MVIVHSKAQLLEIVFALSPASSLTSLLYSRQKQGNQNGDDRNHHQKLNQGKTTFANRHTAPQQENKTKSAASTIP
jgi:hypothetical protein